MQPVSPCLRRWRRWPERSWASHGQVEDGLRRNAIAVSPPKLRIADGVTDDFALFSFLVIVVLRRYWVELLVGNFCVVD
jgi:hypothetical protein